MSEATEREAFEAWAKDEKLDLTRNRHSYLATSTAWCWDAWQAARSQRQEKAIDLALDEACDVTREQMSKAKPIDPWTAVEHSWSRTGIYEGANRVAVLDIESEATEETQDQWEAWMADRARLIKAAPTMYEYIISSASNGCAEARKIIEVIGDTGDSE